MFAELYITSPSSISDELFDELRRWFSEGQIVELCFFVGTYNMLQPDLARRLRDRKVGNIEKLKPDVIAAGNIGCMTQIAAGTVIPVVHTVELIDWATGGPEPEALAGKRGSSAAVASVAPASE